ncbi:MAG: hypothetical protein HOH66_10790 [Rhodospirillaceae bacterium]|jgi:hypothetical protein|nr:hypothetical protein [Rhodospirillaceae bacterium]MBT6118339.1 hypothetical protein [Rhodospirillaceae bacterium]
MVEQNDRDLIAALLQASGYGARIGKHADQMARIIDENGQLSQTVKSIHEKSDFGRTGRVAKSRVKDEIAIMNMFFEHVYFASDDFIKSALGG